MFGWLKRVFDSVTGAIDTTVQHWVLDIATGIYSWFHSIFHFVGDGWHRFWTVAHNLSTAASNFAKQVSIGFGKLWHFWLPHLVSQIKDKFDAAWHFINNVWHEAVKLFHTALQVIDTAITNVRRWIINDIWKPLTHDIAQAWDWITGKGETIWHYLTHPGDLVKLIWDALIANLEAEAWSIGGKLGTFFLALVVHNLPRFVSLVEDILNAVF